MPEFKSADIGMHFDNPALRFVLGGALVVASAFSGLSRASAQQGKTLSFPEIACAPNPLVAPADAAIQKDMKGWHTILETCKQPAAKGYAISAIMAAKDSTQTNYLIDRYAFELGNDGAPNVVRGLLAAIEKQAALRAVTPEMKQRLEEIRISEQRAVSADKANSANPYMSTMENAKRQVEINELGQMIVRISSEVQPPPSTKPAPIERRPAGPSQAIR